MCVLSLLTMTTNWVSIFNSIQPKCQPLFIHWGTAIHSQTQVYKLDIFFLPVPIQPIQGPVSLGERQRLSLITTSEKNVSESLQVYNTASPSYKGNKAQARPIVMVVQQEILQSVLCVEQLYAVATVTSNCVPLLK